MNSALVSKLERFQCNNYKMVALNPLLSEPAHKLQQAIKRGVSVRADSNRPDFYEVDLTDGWAYIHVHEKAQTIYLIAYREAGSSSPDVTLNSELPAAAS